MSSNSYPLANGWLSSGVNMGMPAQPANFQNIPCAPNFTNSSNHPPQNNFKPNLALCPPYDASRQTNSFEFHAADTVHEKRASHPYNPMQSSNHSQLGLGANNNTTQEPTLEGSYTKHMSTNSTCFAKQHAFDSCQPFVDTKSNFYSNGISNETQPNMPLTMPNNCLPLQNPHSFQSFNSNFQHYPSTVPSQPSGNLPPYLPSLMYPPSNQGHGTNITNGPMNTGLTHQNGQFRFMPPPNQHFRMSFGSEASLACNPPNPHTFSNANLMLPPPAFHDPPPYPFHLQSTAMQVPPPVTIMEGNSAPTVSNVSLKETKLASFIQKFQVGKEAKPKTDITVVEFRSSLKKGLLLYKMLQNRRSNLLSLVQSSEEEWEVEMKHILQLQNELSELCDVISVPSNLNAVQRKLKLIKKKRGIKRKLKQEALSVKLKQEKEREEVSQEIDKWLDTIKEKNLKQKREIEMKKEADNISAEVRRKIQEAKKTIEKLKLFEKLRAARQANAEQKGLFVSSEQSLHFEKNISDLRSLMQSQLCDYEAEEKALRVMLEEEQEGKMEEEAQWRVRKRRMLQQRRQEAVMESLFGIAEEISPEDPLFYFFQHHNSGNTSIESLVQIRHHWDVHLSDAGDPIPHQWVVPIAASNPSWEEVCKD